MERGLEIKTDKLALGLWIKEMSIETRWQCSSLFATVRTRWIKTGSCRRTSSECFWSQSPLRPYHILGHQKLQCSFERTMCCVHMKNYCFAVNPRNDRCYTLINSLSVLSTCPIDTCLANSDCADCRNTRRAGDYSSQMRWCVFCMHWSTCTAGCLQITGKGDSQAAPLHSFSARVHLYLPAELVLVCVAPLMNLFSRFCGKHIYWPNCTREHKM